MFALVASFGLLMAGGSVAPVAPVAESGIYYGVAGFYATPVAKGTDFVDFNKHSVGGTALVGYTFSDALAAEARLSFQPYACDDKAENGIVTLDALAVPTLYAFEGGKVYGLGGLSGKYNLKSEDAKIGAVLGAGVEYSSVFTDVTLRNYYDDGAGTTAHVTLGYKF